MKLSVLAWAGLVVLTAGCSSSNRQVVTTSGSRSRAVVVDYSGSGIASKSHASRNASSAAHMGIPPAHLPPVGLCKVWMPGEPAGKQKKLYKAGNCSLVARSVPPGGWLVYRAPNRKQVEVDVYGAARVVTTILTFDLGSGRLLSEEVLGS